MANCYLLGRAFGGKIEKWLLAEDASCGKPFGEAGAGDWLDSRHIRYRALSIRCNEGFFTVETGSLGYIRGLLIRPKSCESLSPRGKFFAASKKKPVISKPLAVSESQPSVLSKLIARLPWALFWALSGQAVLSITRFFSKMVVGGKFSSEDALGLGSSTELGYYDAAFGVLMLVVGVHEAFVTTPLTFFNHKTKTTDDRKFAGKMLVLSAIFSVLAFGCLVAVSSYRYSNMTDHAGLTVAMLALSVLVPFQLIREFARRWLLANIQVKQSALIEFLFAALFIACLCVMVFTNSVSAASVFGVTAVANVVCLAGWWIIYRRSFTMGFGGVGVQSVKNFSYGKWIACENICSVLMVYFSQWFLLAKLGADGAGVYSACMTIVLLANPFMLGVSSLFAPRAAQEFNTNGWPGLLKLLLGYGVFVSAVLVGFSTVLYFYGDLLTTLIFGSEYQDYFLANFAGENITTFLMSMAMPCFGFSFLLTCCLLAADVPIYSFYAAVVGLVATILVNLSYTEPTINTAAISFVVGAVATMLSRALFVWWVHRQQNGSRK